jgi:hypothetical protein
MLHYARCSGENNTIVTPSAAGCQMEHCFPSPATRRFVHAAARHVRFVFRSIRIKTRALVAKTPCHRKPAPSTPAYQPAFSRRVALPPRY